MMHLSFLRHGFILILLALLTGLAVPNAVIPRLVLSAHSIGIISGLLLIAIGCVWRAFNLTDLQAKWMAACWLFSSYANWFACLLGGLLGAGRMTPVAAAGVTGAPTVELIVSGLLMVVAASALVAVVLALWGLCSSHQLLNGARV